jgi:large subunit ribosomal protein L18
MAGHTKFGSDKDRRRNKRKGSIRKRVTGTAERPRLSVFRSARHVYAQAIDDTSGRVVAAASDLEEKLEQAIAGKPKKARAREIGKAIGTKLKAAGVTAVVFDRNGFIFHGRVKEIADGAREAGLEF